MDILGSMLSTLAVRLHLDALHGMPKGHHILMEYYLNYKSCGKSVFAPALAPGSKRSTGTLPDSRQGNLVSGYDR